MLIAPASRLAVTLTAQQQQRQLALIEGQCGMYPDGMMPAFLNHPVFSLRYITYMACIYGIWGAIASACSAVSK